MVLPSGPGKDLRTSQIPFWKAYIIPETYIITWSLTSKLKTDRGQAALHGISITWSLTSKVTDGPGHANHVKKT